MGETITRRMYRVSEVAAMAGVTGQTVRNWISRGELPATHMGTTPLIPKDIADRMFPISQTA